MFATLKPKLKWSAPCKTRYYDIETSRSIILQKDVSFSKIREIKYTVDRWWGRIREREGGGGKRFRYGFSGGYRFSFLKQWRSVLALAALKYSAKNIHNFGDFGSVHLTRHERRRETAIFSLLQMPHLCLLPQSQAWAVHSADVEAVLQGSLSCLSRWLLPAGNESTFCDCSTGFNHVTGLAMMLARSLPQACPNWRLSCFFIMTNPCWDRKSRHSFIFWNGEGKKGYVWEWVISMNFPMILDSCLDRTSSQRSNG